MKKDLLAFLILATVVIASGCGEETETGEVTISQTSGVTVESFEATPGELPGEETTTLEMMVKNRGGREATNIKGYIFNVPLDGGERAWGLGSESQSQSLDSLKPADPEADAPSLERPMTWSGLEAPNLERGASIPYDFIGRLYYEYDTKGETRLQVMDSERKRETGATRSKPSIDNTGGPVQLKVRTLTPIVFFDENPESNICVIAENVGSGTVVSQDTDSAKNAGSADNEIALKIQGSGSVIEFRKGDGDSYGNSAEVTGVSMNSGEALKCFDMKANFDSSNIQKTVPVTIKAEYGYYLEDQASVTVNGR